MTVPSTPLLLTASLPVGGGLRAVTRVRLELVPGATAQGPLITEVTLAPLGEIAVAHRERAGSGAEPGEREFVRLLREEWGAPADPAGGPVAGPDGADIEAWCAARSLQRVRSAIRRAAARADLEHRVTLTTAPPPGGPHTLRTLTNPSATRPVRIAYYGRVRSWQLRLYRCGLHLVHEDPPDHRAPARGGVRFAGRPDRWTARRDREELLAQWYEELPERGTDIRVGPHLGPPPGGTGPPVRACADPR
ncbi:hypothetical protein ACFWXK_32910 [Streptomyces sp. NPDC059070]|uniref:hypothetical protein n=1 Tax=unclassified Streptomyces TaxID=2593676 RepID=UPI0034E2744C